jgi:hypothetical protein
MDHDRLNRWLTLGANVGVLFGIGLLIIELEQNREMTQGQTRTQLAQGVTELLSANMNDSAYADVLFRGNMGEPLTDLEQYQYNRHRTAFIEYHENVVYQYQIGLYTDEEFSRQMGVVRSDIDRLPGLAKHWCDSRDRMSSDLIEAIEAQSAVPLCQSE